MVRGIKLERDHIESLFYSLSGIVDDSPINFILIVDSFLEKVNAIFLNGGGLGD